MGREELFDRSAEYDAMLDRGLSLSGESRAYFMAGRVRDLRAQLPAGFAPRRVLDFGCGIGDTAAHLARVFAPAQVLGVDTAPNAIEHARRLHGNERVRFALVRDLASQGSFDLCYANGVFHHIAPGERAAVVRTLHGALAPGGRFALMENTPWNPGTRWVMARIAFDRGAVPLGPREAERLLRAGGFAAVSRPRYLFVFPRALAWLRFLEPALAPLPLGAQYYVVAEKS
jgi:SAM-dependent methyltransferase